MIRRLHWFPILILGLFAALSLWVLQQATHTNKPGESVEGHHPDAFATDAELSSYTAAGTLEYRLWADRMQHYPDDDSTELTKPHSELYREQGPPWRVKASHGWLSSGGEEVRLEGDVEITRTASATNKPAEVYSDTLTLWPDRDYAETDDKITYITTDLRVDAVGMRARLDTGDLELMSEVRGVHTPSKTSR